MSEIQIGAIVALVGAFAGWLLGIGSALGVSEYRRWRGKSDLKKSLIAELKVLRPQLTLIARQLQFLGDGPPPASFEDILTFLPPDIPGEIGLNKIAMPIIESQSHLVPTLDVKDQLLVSIIRLRLNTINQNIERYGWNYAQLLARDGKQRETIMKNVSQIVDQIGIHVRDLLRLIKTETGEA
ncbi:MAG: hypothetical protein ABIK83_15075 [Candidatus Zixiibacteriota bacterium]